MVSEADKDQMGLYEGLDTKVIAGLIHAMNMAASKLASYPPGHPFIVESFQKVEDILKGIFEHRGQLSFGIAKDSVMVGLTVMDRKNPIFQRFAKTFFEHGIVGLTLLKGLTSKELTDFDIIITQKRNDIYRQGGINALVSKAGIRHIKVKLIDYGLFQAQEGPDDDENREDLRSLLFWENFIKGLFEGTLDPDGSSGKNWYDLDPKDMAALLNNLYLNQESTAIGGLDAMLVSSLQKCGLDQLADNDESREKLFAFISSLNDDLRRCFLDRFLNALPDKDDVAAAILSGLPEEVILDALAQQTDQKLYVPPNIVKILHKLRKTPDSKIGEEVEVLFGTHSREELAEKMTVIFKEDEDDRFVPLDYQKILQDVIVAEDLSAHELSEVHQLGQTLTEHNINVSLTPIILNLIMSYESGQEPDSLKQALRSQCLLLAQSGDFHIFLNVLEVISKKAGVYPEREHAQPKGLMEIFIEGDFTKRVLTAAAQWGKEKQFYVKRIIQLIGPSCIEPLLDRLTEEESKTLRLFYLDLLKDFGGAVKDHVIRRLNDKRWYVVRNLLVILNQLSDPSVLSSISGLLGHPDARVRHEALRTFLSFGDPRADDILLREMDSGDLDRSLKAISLAGMTHNKKVFEKVVGFLRKKGLSKTDVELKRASIHILAEIGNPSVLPILQKILRSFSLFSRQKLMLLKGEIITSLTGYPADDVFPILQKIARSRSGDLAAKAGAAIRTLRADKT